MFHEVMAHIHPIVVHFPIVMIIVGLCYDLIAAFRNHSLKPTRGIWIWLVAALGAALAVATGPDQDARGNTTLLEFHSNFADATMWTVFIIVAWRLWMILRGIRLLKHGLLALYLVLTLVSGILVLTTGYFGGEMVYEQGIGVKVHGQSVNPPVYHGESRNG
jgi:uncharacterized membrane protein